MPGAPPAPIPPAALETGGGMRGWAATLAWSLVPERTTWRLESADGEVRYLKVYDRQPGISLAAERDRLRWAVRHLPVPEVLGYGGDGAREWLLTRDLGGASAVDPALCAEPQRLVPLLGEALRRFHATPHQGCPFERSLTTALGIVRERLDGGLGDPERVFTAHGHRTAREALAFLESERPDHEDSVVCHGDYCVPNVLVRDWRLAGYVDLGALGVADRWYDLAVGAWSVTRNMGPGWEDLFFDSYGIARDPRRTAYYHLLYELLP